MGDGALPGSDGGASPQLSRVSRNREDAILEALGDPQGRAILLQVNDGPRSAQELAEACAIPQASLYRKLRDLQDAGLVAVQSSALTSEGHRVDLFRSTLVTAQIRLQGGRVEVFAAFREMAAERLGSMWQAIRAPRKP